MKSVEKQTMRGLGNNQYFQLPNSLNAAVGDAFLSDIELVQSNPRLIDKEYEENKGNHNNNVIVGGRTKMG